MKPDALSQFSLKLFAGIIACISAMSLAHAVDASVVFGGKNYEWGKLLPEQ